MKTSRSCSRLLRPAQNSTSSGTIRNPPHRGGTGTSVGLPVSGQRAANSAYRSSSTAREATGADCSEVQAEIREPHGRVRK